MLTVTWMRSILVTIKEAITVFNDGEYDKTCNEGSLTQSGHICIFWAVKKGMSQKCDVFPRHAKS